MQKYRSIQVLRAVAACSVLVSHTYEPVRHVDYGAAGVDLFFVISGFIMANLAPGRTAGQFARDRMFRIYPMWWIAALPWLLFVWCGPFCVLSTLTLWPIYGDAHYLPVLKVGWTLCLEVLFYAGVTCAVATRPAIAIAAYALLLLGALTTSVALLHFVGSPMALEFLMGVAVARLPRRRIFGLFLLLGPALLALTPTALGDLGSSLGPEWALQRALEWGLPAALVVWGALSLEPLFEQRFFELPVKIGDASYSIYLFHPLISYGFDLVWPAKLAVALGTGVRCTCWSKRGSWLPTRAQFGAGGQVVPHLQEERQASLTRALLVSKASFTTCEGGFTWLLERRPGNATTGASSGSAWLMPFS
ncbi:MAG: acyltransferase family protein [Sphingomicrobium sp.]